MNYFRQKMKGFTLLELLLVLVIISAIMLAFINYTTQKTDEMRRDKAVLQTQQILNAGLAYYINNSKWPESLTDLSNGLYLPSDQIQNPWLNNYFIGTTDTSPTKNYSNGNFIVCSAVTAGSATATTARILAGRLPLAFITDQSNCTALSNALPSPVPDSCNANATSCSVVAMVNIPGQNLNNARSVNFTGVYNSGACVPAPVCPLTMTPSIMVFPAGVSGIYDAPTTGTNAKVHPVTTFTAYALPNPATGPASISALNTNPTNYCAQRDSNNDSCPGTLPPGNYWRVCLNYQTDLGAPITTGTDSTWKNASYIVAITRCVPENEPSGSSLNVAP